MYSVRDLLVDLKNPQTKQKYFQYLERWNALKYSAGLVYRLDSFVLKDIY